MAKTYRELREWLFSKKKKEETVPKKKSLDDFIIPVHKQMLDQQRELELSSKKGL